MNSDIKKNVLKLISGNSFAQLIQIISLPLLLRLYTAEEFGVLAKLTSISTILSIILTLQLNLAVVRRSKNGVDEHLFLIALAIASYLYIPFQILLFYSNTFFTNDFLITACGFVALFIAYGNLFKGYFNAVSNYSLLAKIGIIRAIIIVSIQIFCYYINVENGLVIGLVAGEAISVFYMLCVKFHNKNNIKFSQVYCSFSQIKANIVKHSAFTVFGTAQELISVAAFTLPVYLFSVYDLSLGGQYAITHRLIWMPTFLIAGAISQILYKKLCDRNLKDINGAFFTQYKKLYLLLCFCIVIGCFFVEPLFLWVLGGEWQYAAKVSPLILLWASSFICSLPYRVLIRVFLWQKYQFVIDLIVLSVSMILFLKMEYFSYMELVFYFTVLGVTQNLLFILFSSIKIKNSRAGERVKV